MSSEDEKRKASREDEAQKKAADQLQKQIDALVSGKARPGPRTLRDLTGKPQPAADPGREDSKPKPG